MAEVGYPREDRRALLQWHEQHDQKWQADLNDGPDVVRGHFKVEIMPGSSERRLNWQSEFTLW